MLMITNVALKKNINKLKKNGQRKNVYNFPPIVFYRLFGKVAFIP